MAIKQIVPIFITLQGDGVASTFVYALANLYRGASGAQIPFGSAGVVPSSASAGPNPPFPVTSVTVDANGNVTITLTSPLGNNVQATFEIDLIYNSGAATSSSPTQSSLVTLAGASTVSISGTVAVTQSTSPWVVSNGGTFAVQAAQSGTWTVQQGGAPWSQNLTQVAGTSLGATAVTNFGTAPAAAAVPGTNASIYAGTTGLTATGSSLNVNITGGGASGTQYANGTAVATPTGTVAMGWDGANVRALSTNTSGALFTLGLSSSNPSLATWNSGTALNSVVAVTNTSDYGTVAVAFLCNSGTFSTGVVTFEGSLDNTNWTTLTGVQPNGTTSTTTILATSTYTVYIFHATPYPFFRLRLSTAITGTGVLTLQSFAASNASTEGVAVYGNVGITNMPGATSPGGGAPGSGLYILGSVTSAAPTYTTATVNALSLDTSGNLRTLSAQSGTWNVGVTGTVAVTQSTSPWVVSLTSTTVTNTVAINEAQVNGVALGSPSNFGTSPGAISVQGVNASLFIGTTAAVASSAGVQKVGISGNAGASLDVVIGGATASANAIQVAGVFNTTQPTFTTGQGGALQMDNRGNLLVNTLSGSTVGSAVTTNAMQTGINVAGNLRIWTGVNPTGTVYAGQVDVASVAGTTVSTAAAGIMKVGVVGATGATWDTAIGPSTAAANAVQVAGVYTSAGITLTTGQGAALQVDSHGSLLVELSPNNPTSNMTGTVPATAPGYTTIVGGIYNSTAPTATTGQTLPIQTDTTGSQYVNQEGRKATYRACAVAYALLASATAPCIYVTGSSTKTVRITKIRFSASAGTGTVCDVTLRRFTALSGGGFGTGNITTSELDTPNPGSTATVHATTSLITTVTGATVLACERYEIVTPAATTLPGLIEWNFGIVNDQALVLRGTADFVGITVSAIGTTPAADVWIEWTEE